MKTGLELAIAVSIACLGCDTGCRLYTVTEYDFAIYVQRLNGGGEAQWANGALISGLTLHGQPVIVSDGSGGAIIAWMQGPDDGVYTVHAQRVISSGEAQWTASYVSTGGGPRLVSDGAGGAIINWGRAVDASGDAFNEYMQRLDGGGTMLWTPEYTLNATSSFVAPVQFVSDGLGGAILTWQEVNGNSADIFAQRVDGAGATQWAAGNVRIAAGEGYGLMSNGAGGGIVAWNDLASTAPAPGILAQHIDGSGVLRWAEGVHVLEANGTPRLASDGSGGVIIVRAGWQSSPCISSPVHAQHVNANGTAEWTPGGLNLSPDRCLGIPQIVSDGAGGAIIAWLDGRDLSCDAVGYPTDGQYHIYAQRIDSAGVERWAAGGVRMLADVGLADPEIISDGVGGAIITAPTSESTPTNIQAQRVDSSGEVLWTAGGLRIATRAQPIAPKLISDGDGGAIVTWEGAFGRGREHDEESCGPT